jgi:phenylacetate-CoA ligase
VAEFRATVRQKGSLRTLSVEIEPGPGDGTASSPGSADLSPLASAVALRLREALGLSVPVRVVEPGHLPRFEMKARRFVVEDESR